LQLSATNQVHRGEGARRRFWISERISVTALVPGPKIALTLDFFRKS